MNFAILIIALTATMALLMAILVDSIDWQIERAKVRREKR